MIAPAQAPWREPLDVLSAFADEPWACAFLSGGDGERARWSYVLRAPEETLMLGPGGPDPFDALKALLGPPVPVAEGPPFQGGVVGLAAYELGDRIESLGLLRHPDWPDLAVGRYRDLLAFDHRERRIWAVGEAMDWLDAPVTATADGPIAQGFAADDPDVYEAAVADVVARIHGGEIFQANIARAWTGRLKPGAGPADLLRRLAASPAPFAGYLRLEGRALVSNSPERFVALDRGRAETRPIKGTRPRGRDAAADAREMAELAASEKDRAENLMIVDLMRNDLARVSDPGTVAVPELFKVESFANVHHLVSTVTSRLSAGQGAAELLRAAFPPGSITGAPKVQAMKVIASLEGPRGPYCGSLFRAGFDGGFDSSVLIRTVGLVEEEGGWRFEAKAGAGIVADSDPRTERLETEAKIAAIQRALTE